MDFFGLLLVVLALSAISKQPTETLEYETTSVTGYEYADQQYVSDVSFSPILRTSSSEDNAEPPAETDNFYSHYDEYYVTEDHIHYESIVITTTEMGIPYEGEADSTVTSEQVELDATPTIQEEVDTTLKNHTSVTHRENMSSSVITILLKLATFLLTFANAALFIIIMLTMCNKCLVFFNIKDENMYIISSHDPELDEVKYQNTLTV